LLFFRRKRVMSSSKEVEWFCHQLDNSDSAKVKRRYLRWYADECGTAFSMHDPLFVTDIRSCPSFAWTLAEVLWRGRIIALDDRTLWECLGADMVARRIRSFIDPWNEQLAVKVAYYFIQSQSTEDGDDVEQWEQLGKELDLYAAEAIKPQGSSTVDDYIPPTPAPHKNRNSDGSNTGSGRNVTTAPVKETWSDKVAFLPMEVNNDFSEGSLRCVAPVPSCGVLLQVPRTEMFFRDTIVVHCALGRVIAAAPALHEVLSNEEAMLVMCLVFERFVIGAENSHWRRLLSQCPSHYPTIPTTWPLSDLSELDGLDMLDDVLAKRMQLQTFAKQLETSLIPIFHELLRVAGTAAALATVPSQEELLDAFSWDHLVWAQSTFDSRAFNLNVDGAVVMALVPLADMINHTNRTDVLIRRVEENGGPFTMQVGAALTPADVGRELWMSYGPLQNWELLQHYGFVLGCENVHDKLPFPLSLPDVSDSSSKDEDDDAEGGERRVDEGDWDARRRRLLRRYALCLPGRCWVDYHGVPPPALLAILRVQLAQAAEFEVMERHRYGPFTTLSAQTETAVVAAVQETVRCVLEVFPTTLREDEETLAELRAPAEEDDAEEEEETDRSSLYNYTLCVQLRIGLKRIASRTLEWCSQRM
jgi:hypothetical protein